MELTVKDIMLLVAKIKVAKIELAALAKYSKFDRIFYERIANEITLPTKQLREDSLKHIFTLVEYIEDTLCYRED